jgi:DNA repair exonuclease SbcCD nuclease subunit
MGVRFVHAADLHLGSPLETRGAESPELQRDLRDATYTAFERIVDVTIEEDVDFLLIAGDLYDRKNRSVRANEFLAEQFERLEAVDIPVYVIYGNHDPLSDATTYIDLPANVHEFGAHEPDEALYPDPTSPQARIWGQSYRTEAERRPMYEEFAPPDGRIPNVGLLHTGLDPDGRKYVPCSPAELAETPDIDYWALGHIHQPTVYRDDPPVVHPGVPQGRHAREAGVGGCVLVELGGGDPSLEYVPTSSVIWHTVDVDVEAADPNEYDLTTIDGIQRYIETAAEGLQPGYDDLETALGVPVRRPDWAPTGYVCRWQLSGTGPVNEFLTDTDEPILDRVADGLRDRLTARSGFVFTDTVDDRTEPPRPGIEELRGSDRVVDEFFSLIEDLEADPDARDAMRDAIHYDNSRNVWQRVEDPEELRDDKLGLTEPRLDDLIDRAESRVLDELVRRRVE